MVAGAPFAVRCSPCPSVALRPSGGRASKGGRLLEERGRYGKPVCRGFEWGKERCSPRTGPSPLLIGPGPLWLDFGFCLDHRSSRIGPHSPGQVWALFDWASFFQLDFGPFWLRSLFSGRTSYPPVVLFPPRSNLLPLRLNARFPSWRDLLFQLSFAHLGWDPSPLARLRPLSGLSPFLFEAFPLWQGFTSPSRPFPFSVKSLAPSVEFLFLRLWDLSFLVVFGHQLFPLEPCFPNCRPLSLPPRLASPPFRLVLQLPLREGWAGERLSKREGGLRFSLPRAPLSGRCRCGRAAGGPAAAHCHPTEAHF